MICRFGWSIGPGLFQFGLILLKIPLADWGNTTSQRSCRLRASRLRVIGFRVACYRWRARAGKADHSPTATTMFL
jgi:hypothetical protein